MAGSGDRVGTPRRHVHRQLSGNLYRVDERERAGVVSDVDQFGHWELRSVGPRHRAETGQVGVGNGFGEPIAIDSAAVGLDDANLDALPLEALPGKDAGRMLEIRSDDDVAGCQSIAFATALIPAVVLSVSAISSGRHRRTTRPSRVRSNARNAVSYGSSVTGSRTRVRTNSSAASTTYFGLGP